MPCCLCGSYFSLFCFILPLFLWCVLFLATTASCCGANLQKNKKTKPTHTAVDRPHNQRNAQDAARKRRGSLCEAVTQRIRGVRLTLHTLRGDLLRKTLSSGSSWDALWASFELLVSLMNKSSPPSKPFLFFFFYPWLHDVRWTSTSSKSSPGSPETPINVKPWSSYKCVCFEVLKLFKFAAVLSECSTVPAMREAGRVGWGGRGASLTSKRQNRLS